MNKYHIPLLPDNVYHIFNRAVGNEKLFREEDNYRYFLTKMQQHILPVADILAYSLLPNHFHLLVQIKNADNIIYYYEFKKNKKFVVGTDLADFVMEQFSNWLNGYTKAINKVYDRKGSLFIDYLKRSQVNKDGDLTSFIFYIHKNAVHHGLTKRMGNWPHDSYNLALNQSPSFLNSDFIINWFGSKESFVRFHEQPVGLKDIDFDKNL